MDDLGLGMYWQFFLFWRIWWDPSWKVTNTPGTVLGGMICGHPHHDAETKGYFSGWRSGPVLIACELNYSTICASPIHVFMFTTHEKTRASPTLKLLGLFVASCNASRMNGEFNNHHAVHQKHYSCQNMLLTHVETSITLQLNQLPNIINIVLKQS